MRKILSLVMVGILFISFNSELNAQWGKKENQTPLEYPENYDKENYLLKYEEVVEVSGQSKDFTNSVAFVEVKFLSASTKDFFTSK